MNGVCKVVGWGGGGWGGGGVGVFFFFNDTATTEIYTLSLHDALPILVEIGLTDRVLEDPQHAYTQQLVSSAL